ncbi:DNA-binding transcriptional LysR family regulator [Pseudomonas duriflava]|uniref:DNA-binding transcriptional LysR family regulator n=1 Tax=Pseudomonas duriflava TaxID=459528 RepID=A0A562PL54_9PSED|nr:DNA-binding transcriptional LysR family regulator [Pseudomonas duriflava]
MPRNIILLKRITLILGIAVGDFSKLDLNLLVTLDTLLVEHNVTRAAERLNLAQSSVSVQLAKLRDYFDDPLVLPGPRGMRPTTRANELREPLHQALEALAEAIQGTRVFEPALAQNTWRVAATDYAESTIILPTLNTLTTQAPKTRLAVLEMVPKRIAKQLEQDDMDLAFHTLHDSPPTLRCHPLFKERYVLAGRAHHPVLAQELTLKEFCKLEHVVVSPDGGGFSGVTDQALATQGMTRRVALSVPHFLFVLSVLTATDMVAVVPLRLARNNPALSFIEPPLNIPGYEISMLWHECLHHDPAHRWLREQFVASCAGELPGRR